jgi:hypothetical protein
VVDLSQAPRIARKIATARSLAELAVQRLGVMHGWTPSPVARQTLAEPLNHGGFVSRTTAPETLRAECEVRRAAHLVADITLALTDPDDVPPHLLPARLDRLKQVVEERYWWA